MSQEHVDENSKNESNVDYKQTFDNPLDLLTSVATCQMSLIDKSDQVGTLVRSDSGYVNDESGDANGNSASKHKQQEAAEALQSLQSCARDKSHDQSPPFLTKSSNKPKGVASNLKRLPVASMVGSSFFPSENQFAVNLTAGGRSRRARPTERQTEILMKVFEWTFFPSSDMRSLLAAKLSLHRKVVQVWFQNKRQQWRIRHDQVGVGRGASSFIAALQAKQQKGDSSVVESKFPVEQETLSEASSSGSSIGDSAGGVVKVPPIRHEVVPFEIIMSAVENNKTIAQLLVEMDQNTSKNDIRNSVKSGSSTSSHIDSSLSAIGLQSVAWLQSATSLIDHNHPLRSNIHCGSVTSTEPAANSTKNFNERITLPKTIVPCKAVVNGRFTSVMSYHSTSEAASPVCDMFRSFPSIENHSHSISRQRHKYQDRFPT